MIEIKSQIIGRIPDIAKLELYRVIGEGYKAMQDGRTNTIEEVREKIDKRRAERGRGSIYRAGKVWSDGYRALYFGITSAICEQLRE